MSSSFPPACRTGSRKCRRRSNISRSSRSNRSFGGIMVSRLARLLACIVVLITCSANLFAAADCDRTCLKTTLDQYLNAVTKHDPSAAPLLIGFRQTENATVVKLGTGVWKSVTALGKVQRRYFDPVS